LWLNKNTKNVVWLQSVEHKESLFMVTFFVSCFPYFEKIKVGLITMVSVYPLINLSMAETNFMKLGMYIMAPQPISVAYFIDPFHQSLCPYLYSPIIARQ
jgi:hypothetical protein